MGGRRILVLAPHTDDGELGAGGTIAKWCEDGDEVFYAAFSTADESLPDGFPKGTLKAEVAAATNELGIPSTNLIIYNYEVRKLSYSRQAILEDMVKLRSDIKPDIVLCPCIEDVHQDHSTIANEALRAFKNNTMLSYELIWNNISFYARCFVKLTERHLDRKAASLQKYVSQAHRPYMSYDFVRSLAVSRGIQIGVPFAEAFEVQRWIQD